MAISQVVTRGYGSFGSVDHIPVRGYLPATAPVSVSVAGTAFTESEVVAGGDTIVLTLSNDTWAATLGADNAVTDAFIAGFDSDGVEATGWNAVVRDGSLTFDQVTRDSDTQVTVTLPASATFAIDADETVTVTVPASALVTTATELAALQTIAISAEVEVEVEVVSTSEEYPGGSAGGGQAMTRAKRDRRRQADQDMLDMVALALPEILKRIQ